MAKKFRRYSDNEWMLTQFPKGMLIRIKGDKRGLDGDGRTTGHFRACQRRTCTGTQVRTRWPDGKVKWFCTMDMKDVRQHILALI